MGSDANRLRKKWQDYSGKNAGRAELDFFTTFEVLFQETEYIIEKHPKVFDKVYIDVKLSSKELSEIFTPPEPISRHGVVPDYSINNSETGKTIFIEVKRQDGWVEGKTRADGRGNAHERSCKYFTPGLQKILRGQGKLGEKPLPFWTVFQGDITRDPCRVREITLWYGEYTDHYFFWRDSKNQVPLIEHFIERVKPLLE